MRSFVLVALLLIVAALASVATASEPSSGTVSAASPTIAWTGTVVSAGVTHNVWAQDDSFACQAPACDRFTLEVADQANLVLTLKGFAENTAGGDPGCSIRVIKPDESIEFTSGTCGPETTMRVTVKNAATGTYLIDVANSHVLNPTGPESYEASATLAVPPAPVASPPVATPPPAQPEAKLSVKVPRVKARARRFRARLTTTAPLTDVRALLVDRRRQVASGRLASLQGTGKITVKAKRPLKKGTYQLSVGGKDAQGRNVVTTARVRVR